MDLNGWIPHLIVNMVVKSQAYNISNAKTYFEGPAFLKKKALENEKKLAEHKEKEKAKETEKIDSTKESPIPKTEKDKQVATEPKNFDEGKKKEGNDSTAKETDSKKDNKS